MFQFGIGGMFARPTSGNLASPAGPQQFGTLQDVSVEFNQKLVQLRGQNKGPDDVAPSDMDIKGKAAFGKLEIDIYNQLFFADSTATGIKVVQQYEAVTIGGGHTYTVANAANFSQDFGIVNATTGKPLQLVGAGLEVSGVSYSVNTGTGVYTFASGDTTTTYLVTYVWTNAAAGKTMTVNNHLQGYGPVFEMWLTMPYQGTNALHLFACRASKMSAPMKRDNYTISDFEFECFPLINGNWFEWCQVSN